MPKEVYAKYVLLFTWQCGILKKTSDLKKSKVKGPKPVTNDMHSQRYFIWLDFKTKILGCHTFYVMTKKFYLMTKERVRTEHTIKNTQLFKHLTLVTIT